MLTATVRYMSSTCAFAKLFQRNFKKKSNSGKIRPAKYKRHTVYIFPTFIGKDESVLSNLRQYGLEERYVDILVADAARCVWREREMFDTIITDR